MGKPPRGKSPTTRPLNERERRLVKFRAKGYGQGKALALAGFKATGSGAKQIINRPCVQSALTEALARQGITLSKITRPIGEALKATLHSSFMGELRSSKLPDHKTRLEAAELGISLYGGLPKQVELPAQPQEPLTIIVESPDGSRVGLKIGGSQPATSKPQPKTPKERQADELKIVLDGVPNT